MWYISSGTQVKLGTVLEQVAGNIAVLFQRQSAGAGNTEGLSRSPRQTVLSRMQSGSAVVAIPT